VFCFELLPDVSRFRSDVGRVWLHEVYDESFVGKLRRGLDRDVTGVLGAYPYWSLSTSPHVFFTK